MKNLKHNGKTIKFQMWDTAGQEKYRALSRQYYEGATGIILVFDVTDRLSFEDISECWLPKIAENADSNIELVIVGNKTDLVNQREVSKAEAMDMIRTSPYLQSTALPHNPSSKEKAYLMEPLIHRTEYFEVSAKEDSLQVEKMFKHLLSNITENEKVRDRILHSNQPKRTKSTASRRNQSVN
jgi:GTPase SAR1 family protein